MNYVEWIRFVWDDMRKWWPSLPETQQKRGMDAANIEKRIIPLIPEDKPDERRDAQNAMLQALTTLREMHTLKVVSGTQPSNYYYAPSEIANFQQSLSFNSYMHSVPLSDDEAMLLGAIIRQSQIATSTYALLKQLKVTEPESTFTLPPDSQIDEYDMQRLIDSLSSKHFVWTDKSNLLGPNTYVQPTISGILRMDSKGRR